MLKKVVLCEYPVKFLQDALHGVLSGDMIMIAAGTGRGKSTLTRMFMQKCREQKRPAVLYSLEDEPGTYATDVVYRLYLKRAFEPMDFREWMLDYTANPEKYTDLCEQAAEEAMACSEDGLPLSCVHEMRNPNWTLPQIVQQMAQEIRDGYKLFILDHLDILVPSENPKDMVTAVNALWRFVAENQIALITFSQLATGRNKDALCPSIDDLRGSKIKVNTPTIVISFARHTYSFYSDHKGLPTYMRILKNRQGGQTKCAVVFFDRGNYLPEYLDVQCNEAGTTIDGMTHKLLQKDYGN